MNPSRNVNIFKKEMLHRHFLCFVAPMVTVSIIFVGTIASTTVTIKWFSFGNLASNSEHIPLKNCFLLLLKTNMDVSPPLPLPKQSIV